MPLQCERCQTQYAFKVKREFNRSVVSQDTLADADVQIRANAFARKTLEAGFINASDDAPCPKCFAYSADAVNRARAEKYAWTIGIIVPSVLVSLLVTGVGGAPHMLNSATSLIILASWSITGALLIMRRLLMRTHHPNSDALLATRQRVLSNKKTILRGEELVTIDWG